MRLLATIAAISLAASGITAPSFAQKPVPFSDPANLRGERVKPRDGRELPIDGGEGHNALGLEQLLRKLNTRASILNIVAHPDDEDGGMLTYYSRGMGARVADISLTRGEGGQNAATGDFEDALGLLRTQELLANDRYTGVDQMFGTEVDFGFSKTKTEAFAKWTHERVLYDVVRAIRLYRPLVLTSTWIGEPTDGHGQHQVSGEIAQEAFVAAGDPKVFPELTAEGILPWQPLRIYARVPRSAVSDKGLFDYATGQYVPAEFTNYVTGEKSTTPPTADVIVHEGATDPLLTSAAANPDDLPRNDSQSADTPMSYVQFARIGLSLQKSQIGPGVRRARAGTFDVAYHLYGTNTQPTSKRAAKSTFFDGIDTSILGIASLAPDAPATLRDGLAHIADQITRAQAALKVTHSGSFSVKSQIEATSALAPYLANAALETDSLIKAARFFSISATERENILHELRTKRVQLNDALALALGLSMSASTTDSTHGDILVYTPFTVKTDLEKTSTLSIGEGREWLGGYASGFKINENPFQKDAAEHVIAHLPFNEEIAYKQAGGLNATETRAYFHRSNLEQPYYDLESPGMRNAPTTSPALTAWAVVAFQEVHIAIGRIATGEQQPVAFVPRENISLSAHSQVLPLSKDTVTVTAFNRSLMKQTVIASLCVNKECGTAVKGPEPKSLIFTVRIPEYLRAVPFDIAPKVGQAYFGKRDGSFASGGGLPEGYRPVGYGSLPRVNFYTPATDHIVPVDLNLPTHHNIAYLPGTGDDIPSTLASIGLAPMILSVADLTPANLKQYDTVILGVRTYNAHPDLHGAPTRALLDYARNGGNVVVQYQTPEFTAEDAPFPLDLGSNEKVVDETAPVSVLTLQSSGDTQLLTTPNHITSADFNNWIEERGHGFLSTWDAHYTALTETHDPGAPSEHVAPQLPQRGGLITVKLGKGRWTYCAFALYRQLPEAVPGAYRIFMNLINP